ncbi:MULTISPECIES: hypothetical protein [Nocardia]|uniref:Uncharacterized protein n=1 Tax=Nocardia aurea TaxID=2144174 RepID=A0ABV3FXG4_9NOCA|nr:MULTISPECIES: hypothetical protein [Nocardia]
MGDDKSRWQYLAEEAKAGRLYLDQAVARECRDACDRQIRLYEELRDTLTYMTNLGGFGRFDCADELAKMLGAKAIGGEGDVDGALREHIEVVALIRDTIQISVDRIDAQDQANADAQTNQSS